MAVVYLHSKDGETLIALDATSEVTRSRTATLTKSTVQDGSVISDHYHSHLPVTTFRGIITDSKLRDTTPSVSNFVTLIDELIEAAAPFTLYGTEDGAIPTMDEVCITSYSLGKGVNNYNSLSVTMTCEQIDISKTAKTTGVTIPSVKTEGQLAPEKNAGVGTKTEASDNYTSAKRALIKSRLEAGD